MCCGAQEVMGLLCVINLYCVVAIGNVFLCKRFKLFCCSGDLAEFQSETADSSTDKADFTFCLSLTNRQAHFGIKLNLNLR